MQSTLTASIGTIGAAQVRFLYGFPFSLVFLLGTVLVTGETVPAAHPVFVTYAASGAVLQIIGTVLMLAAMRLRSFAVATAYLKTEPVLVALAGVLERGLIGAAGFLAGATGALVGLAALDLAAATGFAFWVLVAFNSCLLIETQGARWRVVQEFSRLAGLPP